MKVKMCKMIGVFVFSRRIFFHVSEDKKIYVRVSTYFPTPLIKYESPFIHDRLEDLRKVDKEGKYILGTFEDKNISLVQIYREIDLGEELKHIQKEIEEEMI